MKLSLVDVCDFQGGTQPPKEEWIDHPEPGYIRMLQIRDFTQPDKGHIEYVLDKKSNKTCTDNDILIGRYGASVGKILTGLSGAYNVAMIKAIPDIKKISSKYLFHYLNSPYFQNYILSVGSRAAQAGFNKEDLKNALIILPSLKEQNFIVNKLDLLARLISLRKQQLDKLDELVKSRFIELFGEPLSNTKGWNTLPIVEVAPIKSQCVNLSGEIWLLNLDAVEAQTGTVLFKHRVQSSEINASTVCFTTENVLYSKLRPYLNKVVIPDEDGVATSEMIPLCPMTNQLNRAYLCYWLRSNAFVKHISEKVVGAKMPRVSMDYFRSMTIELPPMELQEQFAAFVEQTDKSKLAIQKSLEELETLKESLMQKYFG